ncbi:MAG: tetratricopeptide repeat protein [Planctomycetota bacterium]
MMRRISASVCVTLLPNLLMLVGCTSTERASVRFDYVVQPEPGKALPAGMKTIYIQPAKLGPATDEKWSELSANVIQSLINESHTRFGTPVTVADRRDTQITFDEADLSATGMSTAKGGSGGQLLAAQGAILGNINVKVERHVGKERTISGIDIGALLGDHNRGGRAAVQTDEVETVSRTMTVQTDLKLIDTANNKIWDQYSSTQQGTEETHVSPFFGSSKTEAALTPQDKIIGTLVERAAREFVSRFMPVRIEINEDVVASSNKNCVQGVKLLRAEAYEDAIALFKASLDSSADDHRAAFGAGVASEAIGKFDDALRFYQRAAAGQNNPVYMEARDRMKAFGSRAKKNA